MLKVYLDPLVAKHKELGAVYRLTFTKQGKQAILYPDAEVADVLVRHKDEYLFVRFGVGEDDVKIYASPLPFAGMPTLVFEGRYSNVGLSYKEVAPSEKGRRRKGLLLLL